MTRRRNSSWTNAKRKVARTTGIPTTKQGRKAKAARMATGGGCIIYVVAAFVISFALVSLIL